MGVLLGDTTGNGSVNATDVSLDEIKSGQPVDASNFRTDVTLRTHQQFGCFASKIKIGYGVAVSSAELRARFAYEWSR